MTAKNKNLRFLKEKIEQENIQVPDSLNTENILNLLDDKFSGQTSEKNITHSKHFLRKAIISIAACLAVTVSAISLNNYFTQKTNLSSISSDTKFASYDELKETIKKISKKDETIWHSFKNWILEDEDNDMVKSETSEMLNASNETDSKLSSKSEKTYTQVDGVDEGDIIKNDGKYIYILNRFNLSFKIYETNEGKATLISTKHIIKYDIQTAYDFYIYDNKLIVNADGTSSRYYSNGTYEKALSSVDKTVSLIYDISDKSNPKEIKEFSQDGYYISSRIINNQLYVITNKIVYEQINDIESYAPCKCIDETASPLDLKDIYCITNPKDPSYVIISSADLDTCEKYTDTKAVLGAGQNIYCSKNNLYVYNSDYSSDNIKTYIMKFSLDNGKIKFAAQGKVNGTVNNQYSLDEKDGNLRIATTCEVFTKGNQLSVLDENLNEIGKVDGFAKNETIQAVRFMGDTAYVITFEQTDPLFVIDLSNPESPEIKGEVKITGFSSMLHPVDENTIIGVGYADEETEYGEWIDGIKLALFDVSDSSNPKVLDSVIFKDTHSDSQSDPKAFMVNNDEGYYAIPYAHYFSYLPEDYDDYDEDYYEDDDDYYEENHTLQSGAKTFKIENNKINITNDFKLDIENFETYRCTYIGDYIYLIADDYNGNIEIKSFKY